jgi:hypothetical protein
MTAETAGERLRELVTSARSFVDPVTGDCHKRMSERMSGVAYLDIWAGTR